MAVRNFWVEAFIDGRQTVLGGGPRSKTGEMTVRIYQRDEGSIVTAYSIDCTECGGNLVTTIRDGNGIPVQTFGTMR